ncbi:MAG: DUF2341 domain-containing protein [Candidatus Aenigmatarchaeota archaeon]
MKNGNHRQAFVIILAIGLAISALSFLLNFQPTAYAIWDKSGWQYRRNITLNENSGFSLTNYSLKMLIDTETLWLEGKVQWNCDDLRFLDSDGAELSYWIKDGDCRSSQTPVWVKIPHLAAGESRDITMYYGNSGASAGKNGTATFLLFDDFGSGSLNTALWTAEEPGHIHADASEGSLAIFGSGFFDGDYASVKTNAAWTYPVAMEAEASFWDYAGGHYFKPCVEGTVGGYYCFGDRYDDSTWENDLVAEWFDGAAQTFNLGYDPYEWSSRPFTVAYDGSMGYGSVDNGGMAMDVQSHSAAVSFTGGTRFSLRAGVQYMADYVMASFDNVKVYKYTPNPPSYSVGAEQETPLPAMSEFGTQYGTTDFANVPDIENVQGMVLGSQHGKITFASDYGVNASRQDYDANVEIGDGFVSVDTGSLDQTFNHSATLTMYNSNCPGKIYYGSGTFSNRDSIISMMQECGGTSDPSCTGITCVGGNLTFTVSHFTGFAFGADTNLTIWDETDEGMPYGGQIRRENERTRFFANYTNSSGLPPAGAACTINFTSPATMAWNATIGLFQYNRTFASAGDYNWKVNCSASGYEPLNASDNVTIMPRCYGYSDPQPDLKIESISSSPEGPQTGDSVTFTALVNNTKCYNISTPFKVSFFLDGANTANATITSMLGGTTARANFTWTAASELHDTHAIADPDNSVSEANETNNRLNSSIGVDWPTTQQGHDRHGYANTDGPLTNFVIWSRQLPAGIWDRAMVVADGKVFAGNRDGVYVYDAKSGNPIWNTTIGAGYQYPDAWMSVAKGILFTGTSNTDNRVHAFNASTGERIWNVSVGGESGFAEYYNGMLISSRNPNISARNASTGASIWSTNVGGMTWGSPAIYNGVVYSGNYNYTFLALDAQTGTRLWIRDFQKWFYAPPSFAYGNIYAGISEDFGSGKEFYAMNPANGATVWVVNSTGGTDVPTAVHDGKVFFGGGTTVYARDAHTGAAVWSRNIGGSFVATAPVISRNGVVYVAKQQDNVLYALNETNGDVIWSYNVPGSSEGGQPLVLALHDGTLFMTTQQGIIYAFGPKPNITASQQYNDTAVDRDSSDASTADEIQLSVSLSNNASGVSIEFYGKLIEPSYFAGEYHIGTNSSVNGVATYLWNPNSTFHAGKYVWYGKNANYNTLDNSTLRLYGGMNTSFRHADKDPNASYNGTDSAVVSALAEFKGNESVGAMKDAYNFNYNATFVKPSGGRTSFGLTNQTDISAPTEYVANGTVYSCMKISESGHYIDFSDDLVPAPIPNGVSLGSGYYLRWTCDAGTCPDYYGKEYEIVDSWDQGSWWGNSLDYFGLQGWFGCDGSPGSNANGWTFAVFTNNTVIVRYWNGTSNLTSETGTWTALLNATADWFFMNDTTSRTFTVTAPSNAANQTGVAGETRAEQATYYPNRTVEMSFGGTQLKGGIDRVSVGRGSTGELALVLRNLGTTSLYNLGLKTTGPAADWVRLQWQTIDLGYREEKGILLTVDVPESAAPGEYEVTIEISSQYIRGQTASFIIEVPAQCPVCPTAGEWSECVGGEMTRAVSRCGPETGYECQPDTERRTCALPQAPPYGLAIGAIAAGLIIISGRRYWKAPNKARR